MNVPPPGGCEGSSATDDVVRPPQRPRAPPRPTMRRRARVSRSESTTTPPARVLLASGERERDGVGSPSPPPPATRTTATTSRTFAVDPVDAADAAALVADLVVTRADADLADVLATSLTVAIAVEEAGAREAGGVGDGERTAVLCELVLDPTNRWRPSAPDCTATRVVDETPTGPRAPTSCASRRRSRRRDTPPFASRR